MSDCAVVVIVMLYVVGALATVGGLVKAFVDTRRDLRAAEQRIVDMEELRTRPRPDLYAIEMEAHAAASAAEGGQVSAETHERLNAEATQRSQDQAERERPEYAARELVRPEAGNMHVLALHESQWLLNKIVRSNVSNGVIVGVGLLATTVASIWSLFV